MFNWKFQVKQILKVVLAQNWEQFFWNSDKNVLDNSETSLIHGRYKKNRIVSHLEGIFLGESDGSISPNSKVEMRVSAAYLLFRRTGI